MPIIRLNIVTHLMLFLGQQKQVQTQLNDAKGRLDKVNKELETTVNKQKEVESQIASKNKLIQDKQVQHKEKLTQRNTKAAVLVNLDGQMQQKNVLIQQLQEQQKRIEQGTQFDTCQIWVITILSPLRRK
ncbi:hypothetical protein HW132_35205 [Brasilonema sp. CT11]|nr:hypothetical protein [Brasilonema sp. CT11]